MLPEEGERPSQNLMVPSSTAKEIKKILEIKNVKTPQINDVGIRVSRIRH